MLTHAPSTTALQGLAPDIAPTVKYLTKAVNVNVFVKLSLLAAKLTLTP